jgi:hypothetical protein
VGHDHEQIASCRLPPAGRSGSGAARWPSADKARRPDSWRFRTRCAISPPARKDRRQGLQERKSIIWYQTSSRIPVHVGFSVITARRACGPRVVRAGEDRIMLSSATWPPQRPPPQRTTSGPGRRCAGDQAMLTSSVGRARKYLHLAAGWAAFQLKARRPRDRPRRRIQAYQNARHGTSTLASLRRHLVAALNITPCGQYGEWMPLLSARRSEAQRGKLRAPRRHREGMTSRGFTYASPLGKRLAAA